jgi:hypothetical protein
VEKQIVFVAFIFVAVCQYFDVPLVSGPSRSRGDDPHFGIVFVTSFVLAPSIIIHHLPLRQHAELAAGEVGPTLATDMIREPFPAAKERFASEFERMYLRRLVESTGGNLARAASIANVDRTTLYRLIEKHNVGVRREAAVTEPHSPAVESR